MAVPLQATLSLASGVPLVVLGLAALSVRPLRGQQLTLGLFAALWGVQITAANLTWFTYDEGFLRVLYFLTYGLTPVLGLYLARFAALVHGGRIGRALPALAAGVAAAAAMVLLRRPDWVIEAIVADKATGVSTVTLGPATVPLFIIPFHGMFLLSFLAVYQRYRRDPMGSVRHRSRGLLAALGLFLAYNTVRGAIVFLRPGIVQVYGPGLGVSLGLFYGLSTLVLAAVVVHLIVRPPPPERRDRVLLAALLVPAGFALIGALAAYAELNVDTLGLWRLASVGVLLATVARYQLFDMEVRLQRQAGPLLAAVALVGFAVAVLASWVGDEPAGRTVALGLGGVGLAGAVWVGTPVAAARWLPVKDDAGLYQRKLEVYQASLQQLAGDPEAEGVLERLRRSLGVREADAQQLALHVPAAHGGAPVTAASPSALGNVIGGHYRMERLLGEGSHGRALAATDERTGETVVVKAVAKAAHGGKAARLLVREARLAGSLDHPNIVRVRDVIETDHEAAVVLDYVDGGDLQAFLERRGRMDLYRACSVLDQLALALDAAHAVGVVHRDVKPENLLLTREGQVKLADFGVALDTTPTATTGIEGAGVGTLLYMSPEQVRGGALDGRSDLYAAGVLFYQLLTGRYYLDLAGADDFKLRKAIIEAPPRLPLAGQPPWVSDLLARLLAKEPDDRLPSGAALHDALVSGGGVAEGQGFYPLEPVAAA